MKQEIKEEEKYHGRMHGDVLNRFFYYNSTMSSVNEDSDDFYNVTNNVARVDYPRDFYDDQETKPSMLLNLDNQNKRRASVFGPNYSEEPPYKKSLFDDDIMAEMDEQGWRNKPTEEWDVVDTTNWLISTGLELGHSYGLMAPELALPGRDLLRLTRQDFLSCDRHFGDKLYDRLHENREVKNYLPPFDTLKSSLSDDETSVGSGNNYSDGESLNGVESIKKRSPGRPRLPESKRKVVKVKLWEFIRNLLLNPKYCPLWICWEDYDKKKFRFVQSDSVAKLWGERKNNKNMTYEKFSRAMRYYYTKNIFEAVPGRRLVYKFGAKATGLETDNPNFDPNFKYRDVVRS